MFRFIKQALALVCFGGLPATNCVSVNNQSCITRAALTDLNSDEVHYYPFMVSLDTCDASCTTTLIHLVEYVFQIKERHKLKVFILITGIKQFIKNN